MTCATWGRGEGRGEGEERPRPGGGVLFFHCGADRLARSKRGSCQKVSVVISDGKGRQREREGRQQMDELTAVPRRGLIW